MFKSKIVFFSLILFAIYAKAQNTFEYGFKSSLNFTTIGNDYNKYVGAGGFSLGVFGTYTAIPKWEFSAEPAFTVSKFREKQNDYRYSFGNLELGLNAYFFPFVEEEFSFFAGIRPAILAATKAETIVNGKYVRSDVPGFTAKTGNFSVGINIGTSVKLSRVASFELGYFWSLSNQITGNNISGRPSMVEIGLKINAVDIQTILENKGLTTTEKIKRYRKGMMLVMLPTLSEKDLKTYKKPGDKEFAINELSLRNKIVIQQFKKHFNFCAVYFFYDSNISQITSRNFTSVFSNLNDSVGANETIKFYEDFFVASFCEDIYIYSDRFAYGLFVYDNQMNQLTKPFIVPSQMFGTFTEGDQMSYFKTKRKNYTTMPFDRVIKKFNNRMIRYSEID